MKQESYNTRFRAQELLRQTLSIWRQGDHIDQLEGLENDPVFSLLITALAYNANETDSEIERLRQEVLDEYARMLMPYEAGHAMPATAVVETKLQNDVPEMQLTDRSVFRIEGTGFTFMPLIRSRAVNASVSSIVRLDGRRWKMTLFFREPVSNLSGITFAIKDVRFKNLRVSYNGQQLPLVKPWQYENLPLQPCFSAETFLYNKAQMCQAALSGLELYARQDVALFYIGSESTERLFPIPNDRIELIFDFYDIADDFVFDKDCFALNAVLLVNAALDTATLSSDKPIVRVTGKQLMHLIPPASEQLFGKTPVTIRRVAADRFNRAALYRLVNSLLTKVYSDHYAFLYADADNLKKGLAELQAALDKPDRYQDDEKEDKLTGVYLMLERNAFGSQADISLNIDYLTTSGAAVNDHLSADCRFTPPSGFDNSNTRLIAQPTNGYDEANNTEAMQSTLRYYMVTNDRIVTPSDIKLFCYNALTSRFSIIPDMVKSITVKHHKENNDSGFGIYVAIDIASNRFIQRSFANRIPQTEKLLQKLMEVRSTGIYPIHVSITLSEGTKEQIEQV